VPVDSAAIFISYRRDESAGYASRIADELVEHFGEKRVVRDIDWRETGLGFAEAIERAVDSIEVFIALLGKNWVIKLKEHEQTEQEDYTRLEVATALRCQVLVIPVLVQGASIPSHEELPDDLVLLAYRNAFELHDNNWDEDVRRLVTSLDTMLERNAVQAPAKDMSAKRVVRLPAGVRRLVNKFWGHQRE
jgi:hypothetical protein